MADIEFVEIKCEAMSSDEEFEEEFDEVCTPPEIEQQAKAASDNLLPDGSKQVYMNAYNRFMAWVEQENIKTLSENVLMSYFCHLAETMQPSTLWSQYSMLKSTLNSKKNMQIENYSKLIAFLKKQSVGFKSKKPKTLSSNDIEKFLNEAPDRQYLALKAALILGITGACRRQELHNMTVNDVKDCDSMFLVTIPKSKTYAVRSFTVIGEFYKILKKYLDLRPKNTNSNNLFLNYQNGKCTQQVIGINKFGAMPKQIALYLHLPDADSYTGHCFRQTSATLLADSGADFTTLKRHGGRRSTTFAESNINESIDDKNKVSKIITESISLKSSTSCQNCVVQSIPQNPNKIQSDAVTALTKETKKLPQQHREFHIRNITNCSNLIIHIGIHKPVSR